MNLESVIATALLVPMGDPNDVKNCQMGLNLMLWGDPGIGKSARVKAAAACAGLPARTVFAATCQPEDASGVAFPNASKLVAMIEAGLSELHTIVAEPLDLELDESGFWGMPRKLIEPARVVTARVLDRMVKTGLKYGPYLSSLEPMLPGIRELMSDGQGVLFLDELSCARPAVQASFLGVALDRKVGGMFLPPGVRIMGAANPPESAAGGWELEPPMANRFCHLSLKVPRPDEWGTWLMTGSGNKIAAIEDGELLLRRNWDDHWPAVRGQVFGFIQSMPSLLHKIPEEGSVDRGRAWPSPRTWEWVARALTTSRCLGNHEEEDDKGNKLMSETASTLIKGCVGEGAAIPFVKWLMTADLPHPKDALKNGWTLDPLRLDKCQAVLASCSAYVMSRATQKEKLEFGAPMWKLLNQACQAGLKDLAVHRAHELVRAGLGTSSGDQAIIDACHPVMVYLAKSGYARYLKP
jgi:MoxR-like ATPase